MHLKPMKSDREAAEADPLVAIAGGGGVSLFDSMGNAWTADYLKVTGDLAVDLRADCGRGPRQDCLRALDRFHPGPGVEGSSAISHDTGNYPYARLHRCARQHGEAAVLRGHHQAHPTLVDQFFNALNRRKPVWRSGFCRPVEPFAMVWFRLNQRKKAARVLTSALRRHSRAPR